MMEVDLSPCPNKPNCVSTKSKIASQKIEPLRISRANSEILELLKKIVLREPRTKLIKETSQFLHFTFTSQLLGFVDDVEFLIDQDNKLLHFRSGSRVGYGDLGVNRQRMQKLIGLIAPVI